MTDSTREAPSSRREGIDAALRRAARQARKLAEQTKTPLFVLRGGRIVDVSREKTNAT